MTPLQTISNRNQSKSDFRNQNH